MIPCSLAGMFTVSEGQTGLVSRKWRYRLLWYFGKVNARYLNVGDHNVNTWNVHLTVCADGQLRLYLAGLADDFNVMVDRKLSTLPPKIGWCRPATDCTGGVLLLRILPRFYSCLLAYPWPCLQLADRLYSSATFTNSHTAPAAGRTKIGHETKHFFKRKT